MPTTPSKLGAEARRALIMLSEAPEGCTEAVMLAHGFTFALIEALARTGLATVTTENKLAGGRTVAASRFRITDAGRVALER